MQKMFILNSSVITWTSITSCMFDIHTHPNTSSNVFNCAYRTFTDAPFPSISAALRNGFWYLEHISDI
jgi:hypothetical protein